MGGAKKFKNHYPLEQAEKLKKQRQDKALVEQYVEKIGKMLEKDPKLQKKAAEIVRSLINSTKH